MLKFCWQLGLAKAALPFMAMALVETANAQQVRDSQNQNKSYESTRASLGKSPAAADSPIGITIGPGFYLSPSIAAEVGSDSNPDRAYGGTGSPYAVLSTTDTLALVGKGTATTLTAKAGFDELPNLDRSDRYEAGLGLDSSAVLSGGLELSAGALYLRNDISLSRNDTDALYGEARYGQPDFDLYARARWNGIRYVNDPLPSSLASQPDGDLHLNSEFDHDRGELSGGFLFGKSRQIGVYGQGAYARIDYTGQHLPGLVNRDGEDIWGLMGLRLALSPQLRADVGWRFNRRNLTGDPKWSDFASNYFDAKFSWTPSTRFSMVFDIDRTLGEATTAYGRMLDTTSYRLATNYRLTDRVGLTVGMAEERSVSIGDDNITDERRVDAVLSYDLTTAVTAYLSGDFEHTREEVADQVYDRAKVGIGVNWRLDQPNTALSADPAARAVDPLAGDRRVAQLGVGFSGLVLPKTAFTAVTDALFNQELARVTDHDGVLEGVRFDADLPAIAGSVAGDGRVLLYGVKGFYGRYASTETSSCTFTATSDCAFINLQDYANVNNTGPFGDLRTKTYRGADYWGASLEARLGRPAPRGSLKDDALADPSYSRLRLGLGLRGLQQETKLHSVDVSVPDPIDYKDRLDTYYYGGYVGYDPRISLGSNRTLMLNAELGLYYADTLYGGDYLAYYPVTVFNPLTGTVTTTFVTDQGHDSLRDHKLAVIGSLSAELRQQFSWGWLGLAASGEYISYAPKLRFNSRDLDGGFPFDLTGPNSGTSLDGGAAYSVTLGTRATLQLQ